VDMAELIQRLARGVRWLAAIPPLEFVVVAGVVLVSLALLVPWLQWSREAARGTGARDNLRRLGTALGSYHDSFQSFPHVERGRNPPPSVGPGDESRPGAKPTARTQTPPGRRDIPVESRP